MKVKLRAVVTFTWEEDSETWDITPQTPKDLLDTVNGYVKGDMSYILDSDLESYKIEIVE